MNNLRLLIKKEYYKMLQAFADDSYLYNYIVNNYSELAEDNIFRNPTILRQIDEMIFFSKNNISSDDKLVWEELNKELRNKNISFLTIINDKTSGSFFVYNNLKEKILYLDIDKNTDLFDTVKRVEELNNELENEDEMEM